MGYQQRRRQCVSIPVFKPTVNLKIINSLKWSQIPRFKMVLSTPPKLHSEFLGSRTSIPGHRGNRQEGRHCNFVCVCFTRMLVDLTQHPSCTLLLSHTCISWRGFHISTQAALHGLPAVSGYLMEETRP